MRTKIFFLLAAMLLISIGAFAQSESTPLKGDVNEDGKVDVADINAIIKIIKDAGGTAEAPTYYWYVGQTDPSTMSSISPIVTDNSSPGWRKIGTSLPNYSSSNKLYDANGTIIETGTSLATQWVAIPNESSACIRDGFGNDGTTIGLCTKKSNITIAGVTYKVYEWNGKAKKLGYDIY